MRSWPLGCATFSATRNRAGTQRRGGESTRPACPVGLGSVWLYAACGRPSPRPSQNTRTAPAAQTGQVVERTSLGPYAARLSMRPRPSVMPVCGGSPCPHSLVERRIPDDQSDGLPPYGRRWRPGTALDVDRSRPIEKPAASSPFIGPFCRPALSTFERSNVDPAHHQSSGTVVPNRAALNSLHGTQNGSLGSALAGMDADALEAK